MRDEYGVPPPGFRLPDATRVGRVRLQVSDLGRSLDYYRDVIGLGVLHAAADRVVLGPARGGRPLLEIAERPGARPVPINGRLGLYHFALLLPDRVHLGAFVRHLMDRNARVAAADHLVSEAFYLWDPDGLGIEIYADRPKRSWRSRDGELLMATDPLDLGDLLRAAEGHPWDGLPEDTIVGHMHLHVGSLERAEALFHRALGMDKTVWSYPGALFLSAGGYHHHLGVNTWARGAPAARDDEARLVEWELVLPAIDDVRAAAASVEGSGYTARAAGSDRVVDDDWGTPVRLTPESPPSAASR